MPTKRTPRTRAAHGRDDELFPELIHVLLFGWSTPAPKRPEADPFRVYLYSDADFARVWRANRSALMAEWRRRGGEGEPFGAYCDRQEARVAAS